VRGVSCAVFLRLGSLKISSTWGYTDRCQVSESKTAKTRLPPLFLSFLPSRLRALSLSLAISHSCRVTMSDAKSWPGSPTRCRDCKLHLLFESNLIIDNVSITHTHGKQHHFVSHPGTPISRHSNCHHMTSIICAYKVMHSKIDTAGHERWGAGVETHFQEIS